jgi:hypothetical protein
MHCHAPLAHQTHRSQSMQENCITETIMYCGDTSTKMNESKTRRSRLLQVA